MASYNVEVAVTEGTTDTQRGDLLEKLMRDVFEATNHASGPPLRVTGMEIDVTATHNVTGEQVYAECKAHRNPIPAEALSKLLGNVVLREINQGWLISTSRLSKDAEGWKAEWEKRPPEQRRQLQIYDPPRLLELLIASKRVLEPSTIQIALPTAFDNWYLLLTNLGRYWVDLLPKGGIPSDVTVYDAQTGDMVNDADLINRLSSTDTSLRGFHWLVPSPSGTILVQTPDVVLETVVDVPVGDTWADYRPARPQDFVGRQDLQDSMRDFLRGVANRTTSTRLFSIRAPSGWGKSSLIAKLRDRCGNKANRSKFYMTAVDMRAAKSPNYVSAALLRSFSSAVKSGFILPPVIPLQAGPPATPFDNESLQDCLQQLRARDKVIILVFDQFEEVLTKPELIQLFDQLRLLALSVDGQQENIVIGFAWKTDAFLPQDHPAYYLWHQLKDRRLDMEVPRFGPKDVSQALAHFQNELGQRLNPVLRSQLVQHCQGFPWLLKKLCIHVLNLVGNGLTQPQVLERGLDVKVLFQSDLSDLSNKEMLCLKEVARLAPAEWVQIVDQFGNDTYTSLLDRRLIVRSGDRLNPYWDIFRDYLRSGDIPQVPVSFLPGTEVRTLVRAAAACSASQQTGATVGTLSASLSISTKSAMNIVRDLQMFGLAERRGDRIFATFDSGPQKDMAGTISRVIASALNNHVFTIALRRSLSKESVATEAALLTLFDQALTYTSLRDDTKRMYALRLTKYLSAIHFLERAANGWRLIDGAPGQLILMPRVRGTGVFLGDAPPEKVDELIQLLLKSPMLRKDLDRLHLRNAVACAIVLGLAVTQHGTVFLKNDSKDLQISLAEAVSNTPSFRIVRELVRDAPGLSGTEIGKRLSVELKLIWSNATYLRRGNALRRWVQWHENFFSG